LSQVQILPPYCVMSQGIAEGRTQFSWVRPSLVSPGGAGWSSGSLVALGWVEGELAEEFAGGGVDDADVAVLDEDDDAGSGVGSADADGVELPAVAHRDLGGLVDSVLADAVVGVVLASAIRADAPGRFVQTVAGVARCSRDRCGRWSLYSSTKASRSA
jgi:hypothetical protein